MQNDNYDLNGIEGFEDNNSINIARETPNIDLENDEPIIKSGNDLDRNTNK
jgi:hypothetical protein